MRPAPARPQGTTWPPPGRRNRRRSLTGSTGRTSRITLHTQLSFVANRAREHTRTLTETAAAAAQASAAATIGCTGDGKGSGDLLAAAAGHHAHVDAPEQQKTQAEEGSGGKVSVRVRHFEAVFEGSGRPRTFSDVIKVATATAHEVVAAAHLAADANIPLSRSNSVGTAEIREAPTRLRVQSRVMLRQGGRRWRARLAGVQRG